MKRILSVLLVLVMSLSALFCVPVSAATITATGMVVSVANGDIDWTVVADNTSLDFAMLCAYDGEKDAAFEANLLNAKSAGVPLGAYMVLKASDATTATAQANALLDIINDRPMEYPLGIYLNPSDYSGKTAADVAAIAKAALTVVEGAKYYAVLNVSSSFAASGIDMTALTDHDVWIIGGDASTEPTDYTGSYGMRTYTQNATVTGVPGTVAQCYTYKSYPSIMQSAGLNNITASGSWNGVAYNQNHSPWGSLRYGGGSIAGTGCGILSTTNALNYLHGVFDTTDKANSFIQAWASYAHSIDGFNPGSSASGGYRYIIFGTDYSNPPPLETKYGSTYNFTMPITWTENWNSANSYNGGSYNNIYVNTQTALKNYLAGDAVAVAHVPGHFICLASYDATTDKFLVLDSAPSTARGTGTGVAWVSADLLSGGRPALTVGGFCVLKSTKTAVSVTENTIRYPYTATDNSFMLYDGETVYKVAGDTAAKTDIYMHYNRTQGECSLKLDCTDPDVNADGTKIGGYGSQLLKSGTDLTSYAGFAWDIYVPKDVVGTQSFKVAFYALNSEQYQHTVDMTGWKAGWHRIVVPASGLQQTGSGVMTSIDALTYTWYNTANVTEATYFLLDNLRMVNNVTDLSAAANVDNAIEALPAPEDVTAEDQAAVQAVKDAYDALTDAQKALVVNADKLYDYTPVVVPDPDVPSDLDVAIALDTYIGILPDVITLDDESTIVDMRSRYDALTDTQKALVTQLDKLEDAEQQLRVLKGEEPVVTPTDFTYGDVTGEGRVDAADALAVLKYAVGKETLTDRQIKAGDVEKDDKLDAVDALSILKYAVGIIDIFPVEE